ncbi:MAG: hypothetical protein ACP5QA_10410 [Phycisphaerae bacterium]
MAPIKLTKLLAARKATARKAIQYRLKKIERQKKEKDRDLLEKWRALRSVGVYQTKDIPSLSKLTKARRAEIKKKFDATQNLARYENGEAYRPFHLQEYTKKIYKRDSLGRDRQIGIRRYNKYELDKDHFQVVKGKTKEKIPESISTKTGFLAAKGPNEKIRITKAGHIEITQSQSGARTIFTREPLSGPIDFIRLIDDIKNGRIKLHKGEALQLRSNGMKKTAYGPNSLKQLTALLERYMTPGVLIRHHGGAGNFDDWANEAEIFKITRR